ncbi:sensor histidine kinase [Sediminicola luteus]|uniref:sensor histidine kinase n=1 Tax=Sediminicola luteus TaxID=319238 RepID=UPI001144AD91|nr:histidine kinase [Sediminicola luteus]
MKTIIKFFCCSILFAGCLFLGHSQEGNVFTYNVKSDYFNNISGTPSMDADGFLWYPTDKGIVKDYGESQVFISIPINPNNPHNGVWSSEIDQKGFYWFISTEGVHKVNTKDFTYEKFDLKSELTGKKVYPQIFFGDDHDIWVSTGKNYVIYFPDGDMEAVAFIQKPTRKSTLIKESEVPRKFIRSDNKIYLIDKDKIHYVDDCSFQLQKIRYQNEQDGLDLGFKPVRKGVYRYENYIVPYQYIPAIGQFAIGLHEQMKSPRLHGKKLLDTVVIWENTIPKINLCKFETTDKDSLVLKIKKSHARKARSQTGLFDRSRKTMYTANWNSITKFSFQSLAHKNIFKDLDSDISVRTMAETDSTLLVFTYYNVHRYHKYSDTRDTLAKNILPAWDIISDKDSMLFVRNRHWIDVRNKKNFKGRTYEKPGLMFSSITHDSGSNYWIGSDKGLFVFDRVSGQIDLWNPSLQPVALRNSAIFDIHFSYSRNQMYLGTNKGLFIFNPTEKAFTQITKESDPDVIPDNYVSKIHEDEYGTLWMATQGGIVKLTTDKKCKLINLSNGLRSNEILSILETKKHMWFGTGYGISRIAKNNGNIFNVTVSDIEQNNAFNPNSAFKSNDSILYFGSSKSAFEININKLDKDIEKPELVFVKLTEFVGNEKIEQLNTTLFTGGLELPYDRNSFSMEFAVKNTFNHSKNGYMYKIDGLMSDWRDLGSQNIINAFEIPPGNYTLQVKGVSDAGVLTTNTLRYPITVTPPFYKQIWFILSQIFLGITIIYLILHQRFERKKERLEAKSKIKKLELKALTAQMSPHFIFNTINGIQNVLMLKGELAANQYISHFSRLMRSTLNISRFNYLTIPEEIGFLESYIKLQQQRFNETFTYTITQCEQCKKTELKVPGLLFQPIVENAIIHGLTHKPEEKHLMIDFRFNAGDLYVTIVDNGIGRELASQQASKTNHESFSMDVVKKRITINRQLEHPGIEMDIQDAYPGQKYPGTRVSFKIKFNKA